MIINSFAFVSTSFDPDAQAFITAAAINDSIQANAINQLVVDFKAVNIWSKMLAIYPFVGGSASSHKWNLKDPRDLDSAFRLVFVGGVSHSSQGVQGNGINAYAETFLNITLVNTLGGVSSYVLNNISQNAATIACQLSGGIAINIYPRWSDDNAYLRSYSTSQIAVPSTDSRGFIAISRINSNQLAVNFKGINSTYNSAGSGPGIDRTFYIMANNSAVFGTSFFSSHQLAFTTVHNNMSVEDLSQLYSIVQTFQTTLGRQV